MFRRTGVIILFTFALFAQLFIMPVSAVNSVTVFTPNGGETVSGGGVLPITFTSEGSGTKTRYSYSLDGGTTWFACHMDSEGDRWLVPNVDTNRALIRVERFFYKMTGLTPSINALVTDTSNSTFTILSDPAFTGSMLTSITAPAAPVNLVCMPTSPTALSLTWDRVPGIDQYEILKFDGYNFVAIGGTMETTFYDMNLTPGSTNAYQVRSMRENEFSQASTIVYTVLPTTMPAPPVAAVTIPNIPTGLNATADSATQISVGWSDVANEEAYILMMKAQNEADYSIVDSQIPAGTTHFVIPNRAPATTYQFKIAARNSLGDSDFSPIVSATTMQESTVPLPTGNSIEMKFTIGMSEYYVNGALQPPMDTAPVIYEGRTMLPIRYVAEKLGGVIAYDPTIRQVVILHGNKESIILTIGSWLAIVNDNKVQIDINNLNVHPIVVPPGRTMLPLRFIAESMGCNVAWDSATQMITIQK